MKLIIYKILSSFLAWLVKILILLGAKITCLQSWVKKKDWDIRRYISPSLKPNKELSLQDSSVSGYSAAFMTES